MIPSRGAATHADRLERWLGAENVAQISRNMRDFYWPIAMQGVPGKVFAMPGGSFSGEIEAGGETTALERAEEQLRKLERERFARRALMRNPRMHKAVHMAGFSSLSDLIAEASSGKIRQYNFAKTGPTCVANVASSLWRVGPQPAAGSAGSAAPGGRAPDDSTTGAILVDNVSTDTRHFVKGEVTASVAPNALLMYDRIFDVAKTMASTTTEAVTGVPTRYVSSTVTNQDYAGGTFCFVEVGGTALAATAHNWTVCQYTNQANTAAQSFPSMTGNSGAIVDRLDHPTGSWFFPLSAGDVGIRALSQMQCSASVATGVINFVLGHPLAMLSCPVANMVCIIDGINTAFNLQRIFDDAAMAFLIMPASAATATNYTGIITAAHG